MGYENGSYKKGMGYVDQIFVVLQLYYKIILKDKLVIAFLDLEKAYDRNDKKGLCYVLRM